MGTKALRKATIVKGTGKGGTIAPDATKRTAEQVKAAVIAYRAANGTAELAAKAGIDASATLARSEQTLREFMALAREAELAKFGVVEFGKAAGGNRNTRQRLLSLREILATAKSKGKRAPFWDVVKDSNGTKAHADSIVKRLRDGENVYAATPAGIPAAPRNGTRNGTAKGTAPKDPGQWSDVIREMTTNASKVPAATKADFAKATLALAVRAAREAGAPIVVRAAPVKPSTRTTARKAAAAVKAAEPVKVPA